MFNFKSISCKSTTFLFIFLSEIVDGTVMKRLSYTKEKVCAKGKTKCAPCRK